MKNYSQTRNPIQSIKVKSGRTSKLTSQLVSNPPKSNSGVTSPLNDTPKKKSRIKSAVPYPKRSDLVDRAAISISQNKEDQSIQPPKIWENTTKFYNVPSYAGKGSSVHGRTSIFTQRNVDKKTFSFHQAHANYPTKETIMTNTNRQSYDMSKRIDFNLKKHGVDKILKQGQLIKSLTSVQKHKRLFSTKSQQIKDQTLKNANKISNDNQIQDETMQESTNAENDQRLLSLSSYPQFKEQTGYTKDEVIQSYDDMKQDFNILRSQNQNVKPPQTQLQNESDFSKERLISDNYRFSPKINIHSQSGILLNNLVDNVNVRVPMSPEPVASNINGLIRPHLQEKRFNSKQDKSLRGYLIQSEQSDSQYVYRPREKYYLREEITDAIKKNRVPQDLLLEISMKERFIQNNKNQEDLTSNVGRINHFIKSSGSRVSLLAKKHYKLPPGQKSIKERYREFQQERMEQEVFENNEPAVPIQKFKQTQKKVEKSEICTSIEQLLGYQEASSSQDIKNRSLIRVPSDELLLKKTHKPKDKFRFKQQFDNMLNDLVGNMSIFDKNLKLKIQMNIDTIRQDSQIWQNQYSVFLDKLKVEKQKEEKEITDEMVIPPFQKNGEPQLQQMLETMERIVTKLKIEPRHHDCPVVDSLLQVHNNLHRIKTQQEEQIEDLREVAEITYKLLQRQSIHWQMHSDTQVVSKMKKRKTKFHEPNVDDMVEGNKQITPEQQEIDLFNMYVTNQIINLNNIYLMSVINKQMEMEQISQERQLHLLKSELATMKRQAKERLNIMEIHYEISIKSTMQQVEDLQSELQFYKQEYRKCKAVIRDQEEEIHAIRFVGRDGLDPLLDLVENFNKEMHSMEKGIQEMNVEKELISRMAEHVKTMKLNESNTSSQKKSRYSKSPHRKTQHVKGAPTEFLLSESSIDRQKNDSINSLAPNIIENVKIKYHLLCERCKKLLNSSKMHSPQTQPSPTSKSSKKKRGLDIKTNVTSQTKIFEDNSEKKSPPVRQMSKQKNLTHMLNKSIIQPVFNIDDKREEKNKSNVEQGKPALEQSRDVTTQMKQDKGHQIEVSSETSRKTYQPSPNKIHTHDPNSRMAIIGSKDITVPQTGSQVSLHSPVQQSVIKFNNEETANQGTGLSDSKKRSSKQEKVKKQQSFILPKTSSAQQTNNNSKQRQTQVINVDVSKKQEEKLEFGDEFHQFGIISEDNRESHDYLVLPETTIMRLIDVAIEEYLKHQVHQLVGQKKKQQILFNLHNVQSFRSFFYKFLQVQYGNVELASKYFGTILQKLKIQASMSDNHFANIIFSMLNNQQINVKSNFVLKVWTREQQSVAISSFVLFDDAVQSSFSNLKPSLSQLKRLKSPRCKQIQSIMKNGGEYVSIFDLSDIICKIKLNDVSYQIIEALPPHNFLTSFENMDAQNIENQYLSLSKMRITDRCIKMNYDKDRFLDILAINNENQIKLEQFVQGIAKHYQIFFSIEEQVALRNCIFPQFRFESLTQSGPRLLNLKQKGSEQYQSAESLLILSEQEFAEKLPLYMISKTEFIILVEQQWISYIENLTSKLESGFYQLDSLRNKNGLNQTQFFFLLENELNFDYTFSFGCKYSKDQFFDYLLSKNNCGDGNIPLSVLKKLIIDENLDVYPFARYLYCFKYFKQSDIDQKDRMSNGQPEPMTISKAISLQVSSQDHYQTRLSCRNETSFV